MERVYNPKEIEQKWQKIWDDEKAFAASDDYSKPKYYAPQRSQWPFTTSSFASPTLQEVHQLIGISAL